MVSKDRRPWRAIKTCPLGSSPGETRSMRNPASPKKRSYLSAVRPFPPFSPLGCGKPMEITPIEIAGFSPFTLCPFASPRSSYIERRLHHSDHHPNPGDLLECHVNTIPLRLVMNPKRKVQGIPNALLMAIPKSKAAIACNGSDLLAKKIVVLPYDAVFPRTGIVDLRGSSFRLHAFIYISCKNS